MVSGGLKNPLRLNRCYVSLACSIGSISLACGSLLQIPNTTDRISLQRGLFLTSLGFIYFISLTDFCNKYLLETPQGVKFRKKYHLMMSDVMDITNRIVSAVQAFFSFLVGLIVCKSTCSKSFVYASHCLMEAYGWFGTAYFMYDIWSMYKVHTQKIADKIKLISLTTNESCITNSHHDQSNDGLYDKHVTNGFAESDKRLMEQTENGQDNERKQPLQQHVRYHEDEIYDDDDDDDYDNEKMDVSLGREEKYGFLRYIITHPVMMIHHVFVGTFGLLVVTYIRGGGHCIYSYMFMMEFSTPFVSLRSILSTMRLKESRTYLVNGLLMLASFGVFRVLMWPYVMWRYSVVIDATFWQAMAGLPKGCIIAILILFLPQIYWFYLMVKGALKVFVPSKPKNGFTHSHSLSKNNNLSPLVGKPNGIFSQNGRLNTEAASDNGTLPSTPC